MCKDPIKALPPKYQHPAFYRPDTLLVVKPTVADHWKEMPFDGTQHDIQ